MSTGSRTGAAWREWAFALLLLSPVILLYTAHFSAGLLDPQRTGTGFIHYDMPEYMASAREFLDGNHRGALYAPPSTPHYDETPTMVQLHLLALAGVWHITAADPGVLFTLYGLLMAWAAIRIFMKVFDHVVPLEGRARRIGQLLFVWGGGLLALAGMVQAWLSGYQGRGIIEQAMSVDPCSGYWMLTLGRTLILPNEAFYHLVFFASLLAVLKQRWILAIVLTTLLMWCHPFAGVELLCVILGVSTVEGLLVRPRRMPWWFPVALVATAIPYFWYLFVWIPANADPALVNAIRLAHTLPWYASVLGYAFVGSAAIMRIARVRPFNALLADPSARLFLTMALVCVGLENHEQLTSTAHQPAHFARGYAWAALFLLGAPWAAASVQRWHVGRARRTVIMVVSVACVMICMDNLAFFGLTCSTQAKARYQGLWLSLAARETLHWLDKPDNQRFLLVSDDADLAQMAGVYTPMRSYYGHVLEEERYARGPKQEAYFQGRIEDPLLEQDIIVVASKAHQDSFKPSGGASLVFENAEYRAWRVIAVP